MRVRHIPFRRPLALLFASPLVVACGADDDEQGGSCGPVRRADRDDLRGSRPVRRGERSTGS